MHYHLNALGQFQSDQYPNMQPDEIVSSFRDPAAIEVLHVFADLTEDDDLAVAIVKRLDAIAEENEELMTQDISKQQAGQKFENLQFSPQRLSCLYGCILGGGNNILSLKPLRLLAETHVYFRHPHQ